MRQLVELHENLDAFEALGADIVAIAQKETDPTKLERIDSLVGDDIQVVCDPKKETGAFSLFSTYIVDGEGVIRRAIPGTKQARARTDVILAELAEVAGVAAPEMSYDEGELAIAREVEPSVNDDVLTARWAFSHDGFSRTEVTRLMFLPEIARGWHVYAPGSKSMTSMGVELDLPAGVSLARPIRWPRPQTVYDEVLEETLSYYEHDVPITTLDLELSDEFEGDAVTLSVVVTYQACFDEMCLPPTSERFEVTLPVAEAGARRGELYGWQSW